MSRNKNSNAVEWYSQNREKYEGLTSIIHSTLESLIAAKSIDYLSVSSRTKTIESFKEKLDRKSYSNPQKQATDLSALRVITFIENDIQKVISVIKSSFKIHEDKSLDKTEELGVDKFGYRSVHFICEIGDDRKSLPEFAPYQDLLFEIQVRTVLQHAWAEIEHDRNYKFSGVLPEKIRRRFHLVAGMLELADNEFNRLAKEIDNYSKEIKQKTKEGDLDLELTSTSLIEYFDKLFDIKKVATSVDSRQKESKKAIEELNDYGIQTIKDLDNLFNENLKSMLKKDPGRTLLGYVRNSMMLSDIDK